MMSCNAGSRHCLRHLERAVQISLYDSTLCTCSQRVLDDHVSPTSLLVCCPTRPRISVANQPLRVAG
jgi:hypothetical protein